MSLILRPWHLFFLILSGLVNRRQQEIIEFQNAQIRVLMDKMGKKRILLTDRPEESSGRQRQGPRSQGADGTDDHRDARHDPALAPAADRSEMGLQRPAEESPRATAGSRRGSPPRPPHGQREPSLGLRPDPGSAGQPRPRDLRHHRRKYPQGERHRTGS